MKEIIKIDCSYNTLKLVNINRSLSFRYWENDLEISIYCIDIPAFIVYVTRLTKPGVTDVDDSVAIDDFNANYKATATLDDNFEDGVAIAFSNSLYPITSSKATQLTTPLVHRRQLTFKQVGFYFTTNTTTAGTYDAKTKEVSVSQAVTAGQSYVYVSSIRYAATLFQVTIYEGATSETKTIYGVDLTNKKLTFTSALANNYTTAAKVKIDLVKLTLDGQKSILDYYVTENHVDSEYYGIDVNGCHVSGNFVDKDRISHAYLWHPYYTPAVNMSTFFEGKTFLAKDGEKDIGAPTTSTIIPGLILRLEFEANNAAERLIILDVDLWRQ